MTLNLQRAASELAEKIAALPARYPYVGAAEKNVYLFTPTEAERDLIVQALRAFAAASSSEREFMMRVHKDMGADIGRDYSKEQAKH